jgi:hypothetical protein
MRRIELRGLAVLGALWLAASLGCGENAADIAAKRQASEGEEHADHDHDHHEHGDHGHHSGGPHEGKLIELGDDEYHAELVHDDIVDTVTIYILDGEAKDAVPVEIAELTVEALVDGKPVNFTLPAIPQASDPKGTASRFQVTDKTLSDNLTGDKAKVGLNVTIKGKSYDGKLDHEHGDHDHEHHEK